MKKFFVLALCALLAFSCEKVETKFEIPQNQEKSVVGNCTLVATMGEPTKVYLGERDSLNKTIPLYWSENDSIKVVLDDGSYAIMHMIDDGIQGHGAGCKTASFSAELPEGRTLGDAAFYPPTIEVKKYSGHYYFNSYFSTQSDFSSQKKNQKMIGSISGGTITFHSITSYICLNVTGPGHIWYIRISSDSGITNIWPEFDKDGNVYPDGNCYRNSVDVVVLNENDGLITLSNDPKNPTQIYVPVYMGTGGTYDNGFSVQVYDPYGDLVLTKTVNHKVEFEPGDVINMPVFEIPFHFEFATTYTTYNGSVDGVGCNTFDFVGSAYRMSGDDAMFCKINLDREMTDKEIIDSVMTRIDATVKGGKTISEAVDYVAYEFGNIWTYGYNLTQNTTYPIAGFMIDHNGKVISNVARKNVTTKAYVAPGSATGTMSYYFLTKSEPWKNVKNFSAPASVKIVQDPSNSSKYTIEDAYGISGKDLTFTVDESGNVIVDDCDTGLLLDDKPVHVVEAAEYTKDLDPQKVYSIHSFYDINNKTFIFLLAYSYGGYYQWTSQDCFSYPNDPS